VIAIGATGFIGRYVVTRLVDAGHEVAVLHRGKTPLRAHKSVTEILGDRSMSGEITSRGSLPWRESFNPDRKYRILQ
jgi:nucleoside-diphosphate-sugar epimerase